MPEGGLPELRLDRLGSPQKEIAILLETHEWRRRRPPRPGGVEGAGLGLDDLESAARVCEGGYLYITMGLVNARYPAYRPHSSLAGGTTQQIICWRKSEIGRATVTTATPVDAIRRAHWRMAG